MSRDHKIQQVFLQDGFTFTWYTWDKYHYLQIGTSSYVGCGESYHEAFRDLIRIGKAMKGEFSACDFPTEYSISEYLCEYNITSSKTAPSGSSHRIYPELLEQ